VGKVTQVDPLDRQDGVPTRLWLMQWIGWDWSGKTLWRVTDATPMSNGPIADTCYLIDSGGPAFAEVDTSQDLIPIRAWTIDDDEAHFVEITPDAVRCAAEEGD
jgi:hypothetical protein